MREEGIRGGKGYLCNSLSSVMEFKSGHIHEVECAIHQSLGATYETTQRLTLCVCAHTKNKTLHVRTRTGHLVWIWWFHYPGLFLKTRFKFPCLSG